ncbi:hypothetical protein PanWU01x14_147360 [Parasponia andersonii]|uniref:Uncharacterized protein n=1 Tax=Parasponia andersonii TaxID=3476 RepID=A0A2P5CJY4_PARAD|nr:hypothetical protein PanWU01x14_147360 [Parasponia andersonii]
MVRVTWEPLFRGLRLTAAANSLVSVSESIQTRKQDARLDTRLFDISARAVSYPSQGSFEICHVLTGECRTRPVLARKGFESLTNVQLQPWNNMQYNLGGSVSAIMSLSANIKTTSTSR